MEFLEFLEFPGDSCARLTWWILSAHPCQRASASGLVITDSTMAAVTHEILDSHDSNVLLGSVEWEPQVQFV